MLKDHYLYKNPGLESFFEQDLKSNFNKLNEALNIFLLRLEKDEKIDILVTGYASPLHTPAYNMALSKRRIQTLKNYIGYYKNGSFKKYIESKSLNIIAHPLGEDNASETISDNPKDRLGPIYSREAINERRIEILEIRSYKK